MKGYTMSKSTQYGWRRIQVNLTRAGVMVAMLVSWELASGRLINSLWISRPTLIGARLAEWVLSGSILPHLRTTMTEMLIGLVIGAILGCLVAVLFGTIPTLAELLHPFVTFLYNIPKIALVPLIILWFGVYTESKVVIVVTLVFFLYYFNVYDGIRQVDQDLQNTIRLMGAGWWDLVRYVIAPGILPFLLVATRLSIPFAFVGAIFGEFIASYEGLGFLINRGAQLYDSAGLFAGLVIAAGIGGILDYLASRHERIALAWKPGRNLY
ncbi:MAG: ABC transporter permease [Chloroflexota bacterium]|nr:MAG: ABC transporter permease [Chloroflexota bacterium]